MEENGNSESKLTFQPFDWIIVDDKEEKTTEIHIWALDIKNEKYLFRVTDPIIYFHLELPPVVGEDRKVDWNKKISGDRIYIEYVMKNLDIRLKNDRPTDYKYVKCSKTTGYQGDRKYDFIKLYFDNLSAMNHCMNLFNKPFYIKELGGAISCVCHDKKIDIIRKLLTEQHIRHCQWMSGECTKVKKKEKVAKLENEYHIEWRTMKAIPEDECASWVTFPMLLSLDIECYSSNHKAMPNRFNEEHVAFMISLIFARERAPKDTRIRYGVILGECNNIPEDKLKNTTVIKVKSELELVKVTGKLIDKHDPDLFLGYNIFDFDYKYLDHRIRKEMKKWPNISRLKEHDVTMVSDIWQSDAYGVQSINNLDTPGRVSVDLLTVVRRDYKLPKYDLDSVCKKFLGDKIGKHPIKPKDMFQIYELNFKLDDDVALLRYIKSKIGLVGMFRPIVYEMLTGLGIDWSKKEFTKLEVKKLKDGIIELMTKVMLYCIQDSELVIDLFEVINAWIGTIQMSNTVGIKFLKTYTKGQQERCIAQLYNLAYHNGVIIDQRKTETHPFNGGFVGTPITGLHDNVICLDFSSLYPSIIMAYNICWTTIINEDMWDKIPIEMCNVFKFTQEEVDDVDTPVDDDEDEGFAKKKTVKKNALKVTRPYEFRFIKAEIDDKLREELTEKYGTLPPCKEGLLPRLEKELVSTRALVKEKLKQEKSPLGKIVLDKQQNAIKVSANSFFGFLGVRKNGKLPLIAGAMCICARGRFLTNTVNSWVIEKFGPNGTIEPLDAVVVYNDTDSVMVKIENLQGKSIHYWGKYMEALISGTEFSELVGQGENAKEVVHVAAGPSLFPPPLKMEFEKPMRLLMLEKKHYVYVLIEKDGTVDVKEENFFAKGVIIARRDRFAFARKLFVALLLKIMSREPFKETVKTLIEWIHKLRSGEVDEKNLIMIKSVNNKYKNENALMKVFSDRLNSAGIPIAPGDRLDFLVLDKPEYRLMGDKLVLYDMYLEDPSLYKIDYGYYLKSLESPINTLIEKSYPDDMIRYDHIGYQAKGNMKKLGVDRIMKMINKMIKNDEDIDKLIDVFNGEKKRKIKIIIKLNKGDHIFNDNRKRRIKIIKGKDEEDEEQGDVIDE